MIARLPLASAVIAGFGLALSSTGFGLEILAERSELTSEHGRASFGVFLFQDLVAVPVLALIPLLAGGEAQSSARPVWQSVGLVVGSILAVVVAGRWLLRPLFRIVARTGLVEVFTATALLVVLGTALLMQSAGLSMGLGAFLAGVLLADSEYRHELESHIEPFNGLLLGLFFMGVGMSLDLSLLAAKPLIVLALVLGVLGLQVSVMWAVGRAFRYTQRASLLLAALLASGGEFAFVVFATAERAQLLAPELSALLNLVVALARALTPVLVLAVIELVRDREETRRRLAESEARFRALTAISSDWYWEQDDELRYVFVSAGVESVMSDTRGFLGLRRWETEGARIGTRELAEHQAELAQRRPFRDFEYQLQAADGQLHWVSTSGDPLIDADGRFRGYRGTGKDITERKRSQAQIAENLRLIEALLESIPDAIAASAP